MDIETRVDIVKQVGEEIITEQELRELFQKKDRPIAYDGFEPSGNLHIAQGILRAINVNKMIKSGCKFKFIVADWLGWINNKMGGDLEKIKKVGEYQIEVWKACGMNTKDIEFFWTSDLVSDTDYWKKVINIARSNTVTRITRCAQIMGRKETDTLSAAQIFYPCMQAADIFHLKVDITQLGLDQRKVNVLAREVGPKIGFYKPVVVSHHMILGLQPPTVDIADPLERAIEMKMSKSKPDSAIFMTDTEEEIKRKISKAYCPNTVEMNPILEYFRYIIFELNKEIEVIRPEKFGGKLSFESYKELEKIYTEGKIHPMDLKQTCAFYINESMKSFREHFEKNKQSMELAEFVKNENVTR